MRCDQDEKAVNKAVGFVDAAYEKALETQRSITTAAAVFAMKDNCAGREKALGKILVTLTAANNLVQQLAELDDWIRENG